MSIYFPYEVIPPQLKSILGEFDSETRSYHAHGEESQVGYWYEAIIKVLGPIIPPGSVNMYVPVSRTAVRKRILEGRLTVFHFHSKPATKGLFYNKKEKRESAYTFIPVSECRAWAAEIQAKMIRLGHTTLEEINAERPDWYEFFDHSINKDDSLYEREMELDKRTTTHYEELGLIKSQAEQFLELREQLEAAGIDYKSIMKGKPNGK